MNTPHYPPLLHWMIEYRIQGTWMQVEFHGSDEDSARLAYAEYLANPDNAGYFRLVCQ